MNQENSIKEQVKNEWQYCPKTTLYRIEKALKAIGWADFKIGFKSPHFPKNGPGMVFWVLDKLNKPIVVKTMPTTHMDLPEGREVEIIKKIYSKEDQGPCKFIPTRKGFTKYNNEVFLAMEHVEYSFFDLQTGVGETKFTLEEKIDAFANYADCLDYLHSIDVVHRDIKPDHLRFQLHDQKITPKIIDIGMACQMDDSVKTRGTPGYQPPEKIRLKGSGDIFSLGACLYEAIFESEKIWPIQLSNLEKSDESLKQEHEKIRNNTQLSSEQKEEEIQKMNIRKFHSNMNLSDEKRYIVKVIKKATNPEPKNRYTAAELREDLQIVLEYKRMQQINDTFKKLKLIADAIAQDADFQTDIAKNAFNDKEKFYDDLKKANIEIKKSHVITLFEKDLEQKIDLVKQAVKKYFHKFKPTEENLNPDKSMAEIYQDKLKSSLAAMTPDEIRNLHLKTKKIKELYKICRIKNEPAITELLDAMTSNRDFKIQAALSKKTKAFQNLMKIIQTLPFQKTLLLDTKCDEISRAMNRAEHYIRNLASKEPTIEDIKKCVSLKKNLEDNRQDEQIGSQADMLLNKIKNYEENIPKEKLQEAYFNEGLNMFEAKKYNAAVKNFENASKAGKFNPHIEFNLGCAIHFSGTDLEDALLQYRKSRDFMKKIKREESVKTINNIAVCYAISNQKQPAIDVLQTAINKEPDNLEVNYNLGLLLLETGQSKEAIVYLEKALSLEPLSHVHNYLAQAYFAEGDTEQAKNHCLKYLKSLSKKIEEKQNNK